MQLTRFSECSDLLFAERWLRGEHGFSSPGHKHRSKSEKPTPIAFTDSLRCQRLTTFFQLLTVLEGNTIAHVAISQAMFPNVASIQVLENIRKACCLGEHSFHLGSQSTNCEKNEVFLLFL